MTKDRGIKMKNIEGEDFGTEGKNRPKPTLEKADHVEASPFEEYGFFKRVGTRTWLFARDHKKVIAGIGIAAASVVGINIEPLTNAVGLTSTATQTGIGIMDITALLSSLPGIVLVVLLLISVAGFIYQAYKGKKLTGVIGKVTSRSGDAAKELYRAMGEESPGGKRVLPKEWVKVGEEFIEQDKENANSK